MYSVENVWHHPAGRMDEVTWGQMGEEREGERKRLLEEIKRGKKYEGESQIKKVVLNGCIKLLRATERERKGRHHPFKLHFV